MNQHLPGSKVAERMLTRTEGATMGELIAATGGAQYNVLKRLESRGYAVRKVKEGRETRYFLAAPVNPSIEITVSRKGQLTLPKELREKLGVVHGGTLRVGMEDGGRTYVGPANLSVTRLAGILGKPKVHLTLKQIDEAIAEAAIERAMRK